LLARRESCIVMTVQQATFLELAGVIVKRVQQVREKRQEVSAHPVMQANICLSQHKRGAGPVKKANMLRPLAPKTARPVPQELIRTALAKQPASRAVLESIRHQKVSIHNAMLVLLESTLLTKDLLLALYVTRAKALGLRQLHAATA
jgi:hypothetical protein